MKRQQDIERILEEFKGVRNFLGIKTAKKRVLITKMKNETRKGIADAFGEFYKRLYEDEERDDFEHEMSDEMTEEYLKLRQKSYKAQSANSKQTNPRQQWNSFRRHQSLRRRDERNGETNLQRDHKEEQLHT